MRNLTRPFATIGRAAAIVAIAAAVFAGGLGLGAGLSATRAQSSGEIHGCVDRFTGALRIVNEAGHCTSSERPLSWSQHGASGLLDVQVVREGRTVVTEDNERSTSMTVRCPDGYTAVSGGGGLGTASWNDIWATSLSHPIIDDGGVPNGWHLSLDTVDGENAEGFYLFDVHAVCVLMS